MTHQNTLSRLWVSVLGSLLVLSILVIGGCRSTSPQTLSTDHALPGTGTITVAIYPYVPNPQAFETAIANAWAGISGAPPLQFVSYDCYSADPPANLDVFVFDGIYMTHLASTGQLRPFQASEISSPSDLLNYAYQGAEYDGAVYGIPQIGCTNILYYRSGDSGVADATGLTTLYTALGDAAYTTAKPPIGQGFMMDFSGGTTSACTYVATYEAYTNNFSQDPPLPPYTDLDPSVMDNLHTMVKMAGTAQASYSETSSYERAQWFNQGYGRAMVGFSEAMSQMGTILDDVELKEMPLADASGASLYYVDIVGVNSSVVGTDDEVWAVQLADLMASHDVIVAAFENGGTPQYLYPVRESVFSTLSAGYPKYARLWEIVQDLNPVAFRLGSDVRTWLSDNKSEIRSQILSISSEQAVVPAPRSRQTVVVPGRKPD
ncbi:MAG: thiamine pyridinylase [Planctomycetota bacterium]